MEHQFFERNYLNLAAGILFLLLAIALSSCGILEVSLDETTEPNLTTLPPKADAVREGGTEAATGPEETDEPTVGWGSLTVYNHPLYGYEIAVPEDATILEGEPGENITFFTGRSPVADSTAYLVSVQVIAATEQSPQELVAALSAGESGLSAIESLETQAGSATGALVSFSGGTGSACIEMRPLLAVIVDRVTAYAIRVFSDLPGQCDAAKVSEVLTIVQGFRSPADEPILAMTLTPTPAPINDLVVVYTKDDNALLWTEAGGERQLTKNGGVGQVLLSDDKRVIAFRRGNGIWAVNADGSNERQLVKESDLPIPQEGKLAGSITGMAPFQLAWIPGSHQLLFNTKPEFDGPGLLLSDDLWLVDADGLSLTNLFVPGEGGNFAISPDGRQVALITPDNISLVHLTGEDKRQIFSYTPVATYSEFQYYARPVWSGDGNALAVVIPPPDPLATKVKPYSVWNLAADGTPARLAGTIEVWSAFPLLDAVISPDLKQIAYLSSPEVDSERIDLLFITWEESLGEPTFYTSQVASFNDWSPGGQRFSFSRPSGEIASVSAFTGRFDEEPQPVGDGEQPAIRVHWIDDDRYLYLQASAKGWDLLLTNSSGTVTPVAAVVGAPPDFDAGK